MTAVLALCADPRHAARVGDESKAKLLENASAPSLPPTTDVPEVPSNVSESMRNRTSPAPATTAPTTIELDSVAEVTILESAKVGGHPLALASVGADSRKRTKRVEASSGAEMDSALSEAGHGEDKTTTSGLECHLVGPCLMCGGDELDAAYCKETGRREQVRNPSAVIFIFDTSAGVSRTMTPDIQLESVECAFRRLKALHSALK